MWLLSFVPDAMLVHVVNAILILGAVATFLSYFVINRILRWFPPLAPYLTFIQLLSAAVLLAGVYFKGSYQTENVISGALVLAETINNTNQMMTGEFNNSTSEKFGTLSNDELMDGYKNDDDYVLNNELIGSSANVPTEEIQFSLNGK